jgi:hypothetical protein
MCGWCETHTTHQQRKAKIVFTTICTLFCPQTCKMSSLNDLVDALESADKNLGVEICAEGEYLQIVASSQQETTTSLSFKSSLVHAQSSSEQIVTSSVGLEVISTIVDANMDSQADEVLASATDVENEADPIDQNNMQCNEMEITILEGIVKAKCDLKSTTNKKLSRDVYKSHVAKFVSKHQFKCSEAEFLQKSKSIKSTILRVLTEHYQKQSGSSDVLFNKRQYYREPQDYKNVMKLCREKNNLFNSLRVLKYNTTTTAIVEI